MAGLTSFDIMMAHMISQGIVIIAQIIIWNIILHFVFDLEIHGNIFLYLVICILVGLCGAAIGKKLIILAFLKNGVKFIGLKICNLIL